MTLTAQEIKTKKVVCEANLDGELADVLERIEISQYGTTEEIEIVIK